MKKILQSTMDKHRVSWLELFYDLVYVVVIARLAHLVTHGHDGHIGMNEFAMFIALFIPVWWAWTGHTLYATRFYDDSVTDRILTLGQMFLVTLMAVFITDAFHGEGHMFAVTYAAIRGLLVIMYLRVFLTSKAMRPLTSCLASGFTISALLWFASAFMSQKLMYVFWVVGLLIDFATPLLCRPLLKSAGVHKHHLPERFGLMVIILLGESVASLTSALTSQEITWSIIVIALLGFISLSAIWWHYFEVIERVVIDRELGAAQLIIYGHLPVFIGLALLASALRQNIVGALAVPDITLLFSVSLALYLLPLLFIAQSLQAKQARLSLRINTIVLLMLLVAMSLLRNQFNDISVSFLIAMLMLVYVYMNTPKTSQASVG